MTRNQENLIGWLLCEGTYLRKTKSISGALRYSLYTGKQELLKRYSAKVISGLSKQAINLREHNGKFTLSRSSIRSLHGNSSIKKLYKKTLKGNKLIESLYTKIIPEDKAPQLCTPEPLELPIGFKHFKP